MHENSTDFIGISSVHMSTTDNTTDPADLDSGDNVTVTLTGQTGFPFYQPTNTTNFELTMEKKIGTDIALSYNKTTNIVSIDVNGTKDITFVNLTKFRVTSPKFSITNITSDYTFDESDSNAVFSFTEIIV